MIMKLRFGSRSKKFKNHCLIPTIWARMTTNSSFSITALTATEITNMAQKKMQWKRRLDEKSRDCNHLPI